MSPRIKTTLAVVAAVFLAGVAGLITYQLRPLTPETLRISSGTAGGTYAAFASAMAETFAARNALTIDVLPSAGANENAARLSTGEADIALIQGDTEVGSDVSIIARLFPEAFHLIVRENAGIQSINDLRGKRVGIMAEGSGSAVLFNFLIDHYEIPASSMTLVIGSLRSHAEAIAADEIDAFFMVVALGNGAIEEIIQSTPTQLISIDQAEALAMFDPSFQASVVPVGTYSGERPVPGRPIQVVTVTALLAARAGLSEGTVERVTRGLFENRQAMVRRVPQAAFVAAPQEQERLTFGVHPGADLYYRQDDPPFVVEYAEPIALGVTAFALIVSGLWQARIWLAGARKNRADHYNLELVQLLNRIEQADSDKDFAAIRRDLHRIFEAVIVDLDNDRIEEASMVSFSFAWQVASQSLNHRQLISRADGPMRPRERERQTTVRIPT